MLFYLFYLLGKSTASDLLLRVLEWQLVPTSESTKRINRKCRSIGHKQCDIFHYIWQYECSFPVFPIRKWLIPKHNFNFKFRAVAKVDYIKLTFKLETWVNAQRDNRPAEYRWRPLFNVDKFGWRSLLECRAVTLPRRKTRWNLQGCPKLANRSQPLVRRSSPYYEDMWRRCRCLTSFFRLSIHASAAKIHPTKLCDVPKWRFFSESRAAHFRRAF